MAATLVSPDEKHSSTNPAWLDAVVNNINSYPDFFIQFPLQAGVDYPLGDLQTLLDTANAAAATHKYLLSVTTPDTLGNRVVKISW